MVEIKVSLPSRRNEKYRSSQGMILWNTNMSKKKDGREKLKGP
jgi:hypothetical protein